MNKLYRVVIEYKDNTFSFYAVLSETKEQAKEKLINYFEIPEEDSKTMIFTITEIVSGIVSENFND